MLLDETYMYMKSRHLLRGDSEVFLRPPPPKEKDAFSSRLVRAAPASLSLRRVQHRIVAKATCAIC